MGEQLFYRQSLLVVLVMASAVLVVAALIGYLVGRRNTDRASDKPLIGAVQTSMLGMLALLMGFTFAVASSRYDARRVLAVDESNSLGTTFLRTQMLPEPYRTNISDMLRKYVDLRLQTRSYAGNLDKVKATRRETEELQQRIWKQAVAVAKEDSRSVITGLFVSSLNESIDLYASRTEMFLARVPVTILWILSFIAIAAFTITGYSFGLGRQRSPMIIVLMAVMVAAVIVMIVDLDRPAVGPTKVSQQSMVDLKNSLPGFEWNGR